MQISTRRVEIAGISAIANGFWMSQVARNLTDAMDGLLKGKRYLIHDRDTLFTAEFLSTLAEAGTKSVKLPPRSPNLSPASLPEAGRREYPGCDDYGLGSDQGRRRS